MKLVMLFLTGAAGVALRNSDNSDDRELGNLLLAGSMISLSTTAGAPK